MPELRHLGTEDGGGDRADTWYRAQNPVAPRMLRVVEKLGAHGRLDAVRRARARAILPQAGDARQTGS